MKQRLQITCKICGKEFRGYKGRKTCSKTCQGELFKTTLRGKNNPNYRHGKHVENKCLNCKKDIDPRAILCKVCAGLQKEISKDLAIEAAKNTNSYLRMGEYLDISRGTAKSLVSLYDIDISHFKGARNRYVSASKILCKNGIRRNGTIVSLLLRENLIDYKCDSCNIFNFWNNKPLRLQLHHKNGDGTDNRIENLQFLCPNCHSQTDNFTGKNMEKNNGNNEE